MRMTSVNQHNVYIKRAEILISICIIMNERTSEWISKRDSRKRRHKSKMRQKYSIFLRTKWDYQQHDRTWVNLTKNLKVLKKLNFITHVLFLFPSISYFTHIISTRNISNRISHLKGNCSGVHSEIVRETWRLKKRLQDEREMKNDWSEIQEISKNLTILFPRQSMKLFFCWFKIEFLAKLFYV